MAKTPKRYHQSNPFKTHAGSHVKVDIAEQRQKEENWALYWVRLAKKRAEEASSLSELEVKDEL